MSMAIRPKQAAVLLLELQQASANAVYADGTRLRLGPARIVSHQSGSDTWIQWGGVKVTVAGTIQAIELGKVSIRVPPQAVSEELTYSASLPLADVLRARAATR